MSSEINFSASSLNDFFSSIFQQNDVSNFPFDLSSLPDHALHVSASQVERRLRQIKKGNGDPDGIPFWVYKNNSVLFADVVSHIFNLCFRDCRFPALLKFADVIPLPKCSRPTQPSDYRPISLLPVLSKVLEKIVLCEWILPYVSSKLDPMQFAYVPGAGRGTTGALTLVNHYILKHLDGKSGAVRVLSADFSKAFDKLTYKSIFSAIVEFKLPKRAFLFLKDFLCDRVQRVKSANDVSDWISVTSGVPQGSVLGPLLFALVINSLQPVSVNTSFVKFADDVTLLHYFQNSADDFSQAEWYNLEDWADDVGLFLNYDKCKVMNCVTKKSLHVVPVFCRSGVPLNSVSSMRLLGVVFSHDFGWNNHVSHTIAKCFKRIFILRNLKRANCPSHIIKNCYVAFIRSLLLYGFPCFCNLPKYLFSKLCRVERISKRYFPTAEISDLASTADAMCQKLFNSILVCEEHPLRVIFERRTPTLRNDSTLKAPFARTKRFSTSFIKFAT